MADMELKLRLSADGKGLTGSLRTASGELRQFSVEAKQAGAEVSRTMSASEKSVDISGKAISTVITGVAAGFIVLVKSQLDYADTVGQTAKRLGVTTESLSALGAVAKRNNSDLEGVTSGLDALGEAAVRASNNGSRGGKEASAAFAALGVSVRDASGQIKPTDALLANVAQRLAALPEGALKSRLATTLLGSAGKELNGTLDELAKVGLQGVIDKVTEAGQVISTQAAAEAKQLKDDIQELQIQASTFAQTVVQAVVPVLLDLTSGLGDSANGANQLSDGSSGLRETMQSLGLVVLVTKETFSVLFTMLYAGIDSIGGIGDMLNGLLLNLAHASKGAALGMIGDWQGAAESFNAAGNAMQAGWDKGSQRIASAWDNVTSAGAQADAEIKGYQDRIAARNEAIAKTAKDAAAEIANMARIRAEKAGGLFENVTSGVTSMGADEAAKALAAAAAQEKYAAALRAAGDAKKDARDVGAALVARLQEEVAAYGLAGAALERYNIAKAVKDGQMTPGQEADALAAIAAKEALDAQKASTDAAATALESLRGITASQSNTANDLRAKLTGTNAAQLTFNRTMHAAEIAYEAAGGAMNPEAVAAYADAMKAAQESLDLSNVQEMIDSIGMIDGIDEATAAIELMEEALRKALDPEIFEAVKAVLDDLKQKLKDSGTKTFAQNFENAANASSQALQSIQGMYESGTRAYQGLELAIQAANIAAGIAAIVNQGMGDPYTAIPRMIAMAAMVAQLVKGIGSFAAGGFSDTAARRQESQGTGSVLGDASADSESIANSVEISAKASEQLVGLNRGMLNALNKLVAGIGSAANMLARGAGTADFSGQNLAVGENSFWTAGDVFGILGGSSKVTDEGIILFAGLIQDIVIGAYQEVQSRSWAFGSAHTNEGVSAVSEEFNTQFGLILDSIVNTVREGALALGLLPADIEAALAAYRIEEIRISLKDLSAEEQQAELQAVFSQIFDGLAGSVVPFIGQFQQVGEGLGETLVRIATEVQVVQIAIEQLGLASDELDPEQFAQVSDALIEAAGGLDAFISGMQSFVANFSTEQHKFDVASAAIASAFAEVGLTVPATRDGMWDLMQTLDRTTESGRAQIATLLRLADVADQYYSILDKSVEHATDVLEKLGLASAPLSAFAQSIIDITASGAEAVDAANTIARAQGREGASTIQLARIHQWTADQIVAAMRKLQQQTQDLIAQLYGGVPGSLDLINERISELESISGGLSDGIGDIEDASASLFEAWAQGIQTVQDYLDSMLVGPLSALKPEEQLAVAQQQLIAMQALAVGGDANALAQLPQLADTFLQLLQGSGASGADYEAGFQWVRDLLTSVVDMQNPGMAAGDAPPPVELVPSAELRELYAARDAAEAAADAAQRAEWARQLAQNLADLATLMQVPTLAYIEAQGVALLDLATDLGVDLENLGASSVSALGFMASTLGVSMTELTGALGIGLVDLRGGLTELTTGLGIDLTALTVETTQTLAALSGTLGMDLSELSTALGVDLGALTDATSLINQGLSAEIGALPEGQAAELAPLLDAITAATTEADANAAIAALEDAVNLIGGETANALAPYLAGVMPVDALDQLDYLGDIQAIAAQQLDMLGLINSNLRAANAGAGVPSYAVGTGYVPTTGLAMIHEGEAIVPAHVNAWLKSSGWSGGGTDERVVVELRSIRERLESLERSNVSGHAAVAGAVREGDSKASTQREDLARRNQDASRGRAA